MSDILLKQSDFYVNEYLFKKVPIYRAVGTTETTHMQVQGELEIIHTPKDIIDDSRKRKRNNTF